MAKARQFDLEDLVNRPGTYFNPQTEIVIVVDDTPVDTEIFNMEDYDDAEWVLIADEAPIDEQARDELMEAFQVTEGVGVGSRLHSGDDEVDDEENAPPEADEMEDGDD